jgi:hypothetical protein
MDILRNELVDIIQQDLEKEYLFPIQPSQNPTGHILGGQPASGKSSLIQRIKKSNPGHQLVVINGDELRRYHPSFHKLNKVDDTKTADLTQPFANSLAQYLQAKCLETKRSFIIEGTMRNEQVPIDTANKLSKHQFQVHAHVLAAPIEKTLLRSYQRYLNSVHLHSNGRFSNVTTQNEAFTKLAANADSLSTHVQSLSVYSIDAHTHLSTHSSGSTLTASSVIRKEQSSITIDQKIDIAMEWASIYAQMKSLDKTDPFPLSQIKTLLDKEASHKIKSSQTKEILQKTGLEL